MTHDLRKSIPQKKSLYSKRNENRDYGCLKSEIDMILKTGEMSLSGRINSVELALGDNLLLRCHGISLLPVPWEVFVGIFGV